MTCTITNLQHYIRVCTYTSRNVYILCANTHQHTQQQNKIINQDKISRHRFLCC